MSGHSKWSTIKRKKEKTDAQRAKVFTKIGREIMVAVREGGGDPNGNAKLRDLIAKAKANNVPNDNIDRLIKKAAGNSEKTNFESNVYETTKIVPPPRCGIISINAAAISAPPAVFPFCLKQRA